MITFYPGPSKVYDQVGQYLQDAFESGTISANHRSAAFMQMLEETISNLKAKLHVPDAYEVYFVSSATECWEIIAESVIADGSLHIFNGAFGEKWMEYTQKLTGSTRSFSFDTNAVPVLDQFVELTENDIICVTHNETSNGTALSAEFLQTIRHTFSNVIAVDATSSIAGVILPWESADIWYGSVQKCFGLPAGMGVMIVSPKAVEQANAAANRAHYNSLLFIRENFIKFQTPYTPNTLGIYLMNRVMQQVEPIQVVDAQTKARAMGWYSFLPENGYQLLVENEAVRSETVIAVRDTKERIAAIKKAALQEGIVLGNGYGKDKEVSFRIANFPAINDTEIQTLKDFLVSFSSK